MGSSSLFLYTAKKKTLANQRETRGTSVGGYWPFYGPPHRVLATARPGSGKYYILFLKTVLIGEISVYFSISC